MSASITMETVARELGVSIMTVSRVINRHPHVKAAVREVFRQMHGRIPATRCHTFTGEICQCSLLR